MATRLDIAKRGDVLLELGSEEGSKVLAHVQRQFAEGQALSTTAPRAVPLPEDDQESMLLICKIAHLQTGDILEELPADTIANFAIACDKYQCGTAMQAWSKVWVTNLLKHESSTSFEKTLLVTYVLDMPQEFYEVTRCLALTKYEETKAFNLDQLPMAVFDILRANQKEAAAGINASIARVTQLLGYCEASCRRLGVVFAHLRTACEWPQHHYSVMQFKRRIANCMIDVPATLRDDKAVKKRTKCYCILAGNIKDRLIHELAMVCSSVKGICLDCLKADASESPHKCRIKHNALGLLVAHGPST